MPIDIANMLMNVEKFMRWFNWNNALTGAFGSFVGATIAFAYNAKKESLKEKKQQQSDFILLTHLAFNTIDNLLGFKEKTLPMFNESLIDIPGVKIFSYFEFDKDINKYYFLVEENPKFYHLILKINRYINFLNGDIALFNEDSAYNNCQNSIELLEKIKDDTDNLISLLISLLNALQTCPKKHCIDELKKMNALFNFYDSEASKEILKVALANPKNLKGWDNTKDFWTWKKWALENNDFDFQISQLQEVQNAD